jgi:HSF-type DNA-binding
VSIGRVSSIIALRQKEIRQCRGSLTRMHRLGRARVVQTWWNGWAMLSSTLIPKVVDHLQQFGVARTLGQRRNAERADCFLTDSRMPLIERKAANASRKRMVALQSINTRLQPMVPKWWFKRRWTLQPTRWLLILVRPRICVLNLRCRRLCGLKSIFLVSTVYHDHSKGDSNGTTLLDCRISVRPAKITLTNESFLNKLSSMLMNVAGTGHSSVNWLPHGRAFVIHDKKRFAEEVLPCYFHCLGTFTSFQRKLCTYGFLRLPCSKDGVNPNVSYYHEKFLRGQPELMELIPRTRLKRHSMRRPLDPNSQPNFSGMMVLPDAPKEIWAVSAGLKTVGLTGNLYAPSTILASSQEMLNDCNSYGLTRNNPGFTRRGTFDGTSNLGRHGLAAQQLPPSEGSRPFYGPRKLVSNDAPPREISVVVRAQSPFVLERGLRNYASFDDFDDSRR